MGTDNLLDRIIAYGADRKEIYDRFCGNIELYELCFREFLNDSNMDKLRTALKTKDYKKAFESAHALKGLSGNLGVTGFYNAICVLVESLRFGKTENVDGEYETVLKEYERLTSIAVDLK